MLIDPATRAMAERRLRSNLQLRLGENALTQAMLENPIGLFGNEAEEAVTIVLDALTEAGKILVDRDLTEQETVRWMLEDDGELCWTASTGTPPADWGPFATATRTIGPWRPADEQSAALLREWCEKAHGDRDGRCPACQVLAGQQGGDGDG